MRATDIRNSDMLLAAGLNADRVEINSEELRKARWVNVNEELPTEEGFYFVLTDESWMQGIATYFKNEENGQFEFDVWWAISGKDPKVEFWLKDHVHGLVFEQKKNRGDFGKSLKKGGSDE